MSYAANAECIRPILNLLGWASEKNAPWSASVCIRTARILPSWRSAISPSRYTSRANPVEIRLPDLSSIHFTGRSSRIEARIEQT